MSWNVKFIAKQLLNTLSCRVDKDIKETLYQNKVFLKNQWNFLEKNILCWSLYHIRYIGWAIVLAFLVVGNLIRWQQSFTWVKTLVMKFQCLDWQSTFLSGQLTIVGMVCPLVVCLISVLFQNKSAKKTIFPIYHRYSGFMFAVLSGFALSVFIILSYFVRALCNASTYVTFFITSAIWLGLNLLLTAYFVHRTFQMLNDAFMQRVILRFSINELEFDIRERIQRILLLAAVKHKLLVNPDERILNVLTYDARNEKVKKNCYEEEVTRSVAHNGKVKNIRYGLINIAIRLQIAILRFRKIDGCTIIIQPLRKSQYSKDFVVAKYITPKVDDISCERGPSKLGGGLNPLVKLLIKSAFSFQNEDQINRIRQSEIFKGLVGPANDALRDGNVQDFSDAVNNIVDWHTEIALASSFKNDDGNEDNWLLLNSSSFLGRSYLDDLFSAYYQIARNTVEKIPDNSSFYNDMLYLYKNIFSKISDDRDKIIEQEIRPLIVGNYYMWCLLMEWRSYSSTSGDLRIANKYEDILYDFVGAWESWLVDIKKLRTKDDIGVYYTTLMTHLEFTAHTAIFALRFNNYEAAGWGVDMLNNWLHKRLLDDETYEQKRVQYSWLSVLVNHCYLKNKPDDHRWNIILNGNEYDPTVVFNLAFKNTCLDLRILTACYILLKPGQEQQELLATYVKKLLSEEPVHNTGAGTRPYSPILNAGNLLGVYIRSRDYPDDYNREGSYSCWLSSILELFNTIIDKTRRVSGRVYSSGWSATNLKRLDRAYVEIAILLSEEKWKLPDAWWKAIRSDAFRDTDLESIASDLREWIKIAKEKRTYILFDEDSSVKLIPNFCDSINEMLNSIDDIINKSKRTQYERIAKEDIDKERLKKIGMSCSQVFNKFFNSATRPFPLNLFKNIEYKEKKELYDNFVYKFTILYSKAKVTQLVSDEAFYEDEFNENLLSEIQYNVLKKILLCPSTEKHYSDIDHILSDISKLTSTMTSPVLFAGSQVLSGALERSLYDRNYDMNIAQKHDISLMDGFGSEYICHIGRCEVYACGFKDMNYSLLTTKVLFAKVAFLQINDEQFVETDFIPDEENKTIGELELKYWMDIELSKKISVIKLELD